MMRQRWSHQSDQLKRVLPIVFLSLSLMMSGMACAPTFKGPTSPSGYQFSLQAYPSPIWLPNSLYRTDRFPTQSTLTVKVQNAQGQPVDGVPVIFSLPADWTSYATLEPQRVITQNGVAEAVFQARTTGAPELTAQVENLTQHVYVPIETYGDLKRE